MAIQPTTACQRSASAEGGRFALLLFAFPLLFFLEAI
jgi:hypothetical protein